MSAETVIARRRAEQRALIQRASDFVEAIPAEAGLIAAAVFGSVARGDFNLWSDIDLLVIVAGATERSLDRPLVLGPPAPRVQAIVWTPEEFERAFAAGNPIALEAVTAGVWLAGEPPRT